MNTGLLFAKHCDIKNMQEPYQNGLSRNAFNKLIQEYDSIRVEKLVMQLLADKNMKLIKHLAKRKIEDCKYSAYSCYDAGNEAEGDYGDWKDWEKILAEFATEILTKVSKQSA